MIPIILAAGRGERFAQEGFTLPKPLIEFMGKPMIHHALQFARHTCDRKPIVVGTPQVIKAVTADAACTVEVFFTQPGPAMSALLAGGVVQPGVPVMVMDCDSLFSESLIMPAIRAFERSDDSAGLVGVRRTASQKGSAFCSFRYVTGASTAPGGWAYELQEKSSLNEWIGVGIYFFRTFEVLRGGAMQSYCDVVGVQDEVHVSSAVRNGGLKTGFPFAFECPQACWTPLGTPAQLSAAEQRR